MNKNDHTNISFVVDCILLIVQYLNPFSLGKKFISQTDQHYVNMVWERSKPKSLYKFICREENIMLSNQLDVTYQKPSKIVNEYVYYKKKTVELRQCFKEYQLIYQYVYSLLFPRIGPLYCFQERVKNQSTLCSATRSDRIRKKHAHHYSQHQLLNSRSSLKIMKTDQDCL